jgi:beta-xylosidase
MTMKLLFTLLALTVTATAAADRWDSPHAANPILPGYYADPTVLADAGKYYVYATLDPWGGDTLGCWESSDFKQWNYRVLNWPTKQACTSPTSKAAKVWAPSVVKGKDGRFHMFISVGSEIWTGVADHPLGPWRNALGDKPLVSANYNPTYHMIDADAFVDDDGTAYLYWGSGWNWVNGACFAAKLNGDLSGFDGQVQIVTPSNYFEGPTMLKHGGRYYLTYSNGKTVSDTYEVRYAVSDHPLGPFNEGATSPILVTDRKLDVVSPGHHGFFRQGERDYIVYHRHRVPFVEDTAFRQVCIDDLRFTMDGLIEKVVPTHRGPALVQNRTAGRNNFADAASGATATASSTATDLTPPGRVLDDNFATRWTPQPEANRCWIQLDLGAERKVGRSEIRFEYAWKTYFFSVEASSDAQSWRTVADYRTKPATGSPVAIEHTVAARYLRLIFPEATKGRDIAILEWAVF